MVNGIQMMLNKACWW